MNRLITDCDERLQKAWEYAVIKFKEKHPDLTPKICCSYRSPEEQDADYAIGRTAMGINSSDSLPMGRKITNAQAWQSPHNVSPPNTQAFDYFFVDANGKANWESSFYREFSIITLDYDSTLVWGGSFKGLTDADHLETPDWKTFIPSL